MSVAPNDKNCFNELIALKGGCSTYAPTSGLYSDDIDITKDFINEIITRNFSGANDFFEKKKAFAIKTVSDQVITFMQPNFRTASLLDNYRAGIFQDDMKLIAGDGNLKGINFDLWNSESYLDFFLNEISIQIDTSGAIDILVYDLIQNKLLDTISIDAVADEIVTVYPQKVYKSGRRKLNLFIGYDSTGISSNGTYLKRGYCDDCGGSKYISNQHEIIHAAKIDGAGQMLKKNLKYSSETGGISIVHSLSCNHENWLCSYTNLLGLPLLYKYGELVMEYAINVSDNDRTNTTVSLNREELTGRLAIYKERFAESFQNIINNIKTPSDRQCYVCREVVHHAFAM